MRDLQKESYKILIKKKQKTEGIKRRAMYALKIHIHRVLFVMFNDYFRDVSIYKNYFYRLFRKVI